MYYVTHPIHVWYIYLHFPCLIPFLGHTWVLRVLYDIMSSLYIYDMYSLFYPLAGKVCVADCMLRICQVIQLDSRSLCPLVGATKGSRTTIPQNRSQTIAKHTYLPWESNHH